MTTPTTAADVQPSDAVVAFRESPEAKSRLGSELGVTERRALALAMLVDVLEALQASSHIARIWLVGDVPALPSHLDKLRVLPSNAALNEAIAAAHAQAIAAGAAGVLIAHADLPLLTAAEIDDFLLAAATLPRSPGSVRLAPCQAYQGTNLKWLPHGVPLLPRFGENSFGAHRSAYGAAGVSVDEAAMVPDVDTPADLVELRAALVRSPDLAPHTRKALGLAQPDLPEAARVAGFVDVPLAELMPLAAAVRDRAFGHQITYSPKVFLPITHLCRDVCHYCTFAKTPRNVSEPYMSEQAVLEVARRGAEMGCREALFTLGDRPEDRYPAARRALEALGFPSTLAYVQHLARRVLRETGLLPHINAGVMSAQELAGMRGVSASMGLMLETVAPRLSERGMPHHGSPDKHPVVRLAALRRAGEAGVPFTSGILIGIGETRAERLQALLALRELHARYGHLQEVIIQNFRAKPGTRMASAPEPDLQELQWTIAAARLIFGGEVSVQAPPNLTEEAGWSALLEAGIDDLGGISPLTPDFVNPEAPWPHVTRLRAVLRAAGFHLRERLTAYPRYIAAGERWMHADVRPKVLLQADATGLARDDDWRAGISTESPPPPVRGNRRSTLEGLLESVLRGAPPAESDIVRLFGARGEDYAAVLEAADQLRQRVNGDAVGYVVNRNINYTNQCTYHCGFCAFSTGKVALKMRESPYRLDLEEVARRVVEAAAKGATEVCLQGGIHPEFTGETYLSICRAVREAVPRMHIHAFSPLEVRHGASTLGLSVKEFLARLQRAGLSTLPGTAAEILDDEIRAIICPDKLNTEEWLGVMADAHSLGLKSTATIMYGHVETPLHWARHLLRLRALQERSGGFTEFVPLPFVAEGAPIFRRGRARPGPTFREAVLMHAVARLTLHPAFKHVQTSWVKMGEEGARRCLAAGADDLGGTLMNESISRAAGAKHGQEFTPERMRALIESAGREPYQRSTLYASLEPRTARDHSLFAPPACAALTTSDHLNS